MSSERAEKLGIYGRILGSGAGNVAVGGQMVQGGWESGDLFAMNPESESAAVNEKKPRSTREWVWLFVLPLIGRRDEREIESGGKRD